MSNELAPLESFKKKQDLTIVYYQRIVELRRQRNALTSKLKRLEDVFQRLIMTDPNSDLQLFENQDQELFSNDFSPENNNTITS